MRRTILAVLCTAALAGCATIMHGTKQGVGISSMPSAAKVTVDNSVKGVTPVVLELSRKDNHIVKLELDGYQAYETTLTRKTSGWVWGNIVFGGIPGLAVDAISGGLYVLTPEQISGQMGQRTSALRRDGIYIVLVPAPDPSWQRIAIMERR